MEELKNATFLIKSSSNKSFGTGFCIYKDDRGSFLLTAGHVVEACGKEDLQVDSYNATLLHISEDNDIIDLALIYVEGLTDTVALKLSNETALKDESFQIDGFRPHKDGIYRKEPLEGFIYDKLKDSNTTSLEEEKVIVNENNSTNSTIEFNKNKTQNSTIKVFQ